MNHFNLERIIRPNILALQPYRCARDDYQDGILLDANENALGHSIASTKDDKLDSDLLNAALHRYPDPTQQALKTRIAQLRSITSTENVFLGVGSDEIIDLLIRITCTPGSQGDAILITPPTYGMYSVCAHVNDVKVLKVNLNADFSLEVSKVSVSTRVFKEVGLTFYPGQGNHPQ
jgi:histidinol-phosphate aminotransferase